MFKKKSAIYLIILALVVLLILTSCDARKGVLNVNEVPTIIITDYFGADSTSQINESHLFQQTVQWSGTDSDGVVEGYAFRVLNDEGIPIATPGHNVLDENGWVKFYSPSAHQDIPLNQSAETTIWMDQSYATINFPAADANGDSANVVSLFEVKCIDDRGEESEVASKYFQAHSNTPSALFKVNIDGETIGTAIIFEFMMQDDDPFVGATPYYFEYKLERRYSTGDIITESEGGYPDEWISTLGTDDVALALHSATNGNALIPNITSDNKRQDLTFLSLKAIDTALIISNVSELSFIVQEGFYPDTIIYYGDRDKSISPIKANGIYGLGTNHFATYLDEAISDIIPSVLTSDGAHHATSFWYNNEGKYVAIGSNDFKTYMRWGYSGEFEDNNPHEQRLEEIKDEITGNSYYCEITNYDIRLDGQPYFYPPIPAVGDHLQIDDDGKRWLRIDVNDAIGQEAVVTLTSFGGSLDNMYGEHTLEVRAVDLQGAVDLTPHEFTYTIVQPIPKEEKNGVLIIDDEGNTNEAPGELVDDFYTYIVSDYTTDPGYLNRDIINLSIVESGMGGLHYGKSIIAPSDIQQYKAIIYHSDNPTAEFNFWKEFEALKIYLLQGGNLVLSGGSTLKIIHQKCSQNAFNIFDEYFGISMSDQNAIGRASTSFNDNPFLITASAEDGYNDINLLLPSFNTTITNQMVPFLSVNGLAPVAYFNNHEAEVIYNYGCKEVADDPPGIPWHINPTQDEYDDYNGLPVALKQVTENNSCYIFGFPLTYMEADNVKTMMTQILNELP